MSVRPCAPRFAGRCLPLALAALAACAQGGSRRDTGGGSIDAGAGADAIVIGLDAPFVALDAPLGMIDAAAEAPDAPVGDRDAAAIDAFAIPGTDAFSAPPDAFVPTPDAFVPRSDAFAGTDAASAGCSETPCRLLAPQCGCPMGQSCYPSGATRVCAASGTRLEGTGCTGVTDCSPGLGCVNFSSDAARPGLMCSRVCATDADCGGGLCVHTIDDGTGATVPGLRFCSRACTPAPNTGCAPGLVCSLFQESTGAMRIFTDCTGPEGGGRQGAPCLDDLDCAGGFACFNTGAGNECLAWCRVASPSCPIGTSCIGIGIAGGVEWGACG